MIYIYVPNKCLSYNPQQKLGCDLQACESSGADVGIPSVFALCSMTESSVLLYRQHKTQGKGQRIPDCFKQSTHWPRDKMWLAFIFLAGQPRMPPIQEWAVWLLVISLVASFESQVASWIIKNMLYWNKYQVHYIFCFPLSLPSQCYYLPTGEKYKFEKILQKKKDEYHFILLILHFP